MQESLPSSCFGRMSNVQYIVMKRSVSEVRHTRQAYNNRILSTDKLYQLVSVEFHRRMIHRFNGSMSLIRKVLPTNSTQNFKAKAPQCKKLMPNIIIASSLRSFSAFPKAPPSKTFDPRCCLYFRYEVCKCLNTRKFLIFT